MRKQDIVVGIGPAERRQNISVDGGGDAALIRTREWNDDPSPTAWKRRKIGFSARHRGKVNPYRAPSLRPLHDRRDLKKFRLIQQPYMHQ
jgi:hypothetical protein